jgi:hypothetical protein
LLLACNLIRVHETTHTIFNTQNIVVHSVHISVEGTRISYETSGIQSTEVERTCWLKLECFEAEWVQETISDRGIHVVVGGVVIERARRVVWVGLFTISDIGAIDLQSKVTGIIRNITTSRGGGDVLDWVIVVDLLDRGTRLDGTLCLSDDHVLWSTRQRRAFIGVQVDVLSVNFVVIIYRGVPSDTQFDIVVLERNQWNRGLPVFTERKVEWVEARLWVASIWTFRVGLSHHSWCDVLREVRRLVINNLASHQQFNLLNSTNPLISVVWSWGATRDVAVTEEIPLAFETHGRDTTRGWDALEHLAFHGLGKVCVTTIVRAPEAYFGLADDMSILGTDGDELGNTTRHFIYIEVIFLNRIIFT